MINEKNISIAVRALVINVVAALVIVGMAGIAGAADANLLNYSGAEQPASTTGSISVSSSPSGADIYLDGSYQSTTPNTLNNVPAGNHTITLKFNNNQVTTTVYVVAGQSSTFSAQLTKMTGISVSSTPSGAMIFIDGDDFEYYEGNTPNDIEVPAGSHSIKLRLGHYVWSNTIDVKNGSMLNVSATLNETFRMPPSVSLIPVANIIKQDQDVIVNLHLYNPSLNDVTLNIDAQVSVPPGLHVSGEDFSMKQWEIIDEGYRYTSGAEKISGTFSIPPGESRDFSLLVKADESARNGTHIIRFTGLYYPDDNKGDFEIVELSYALKVVMPPKEITVQTPIPVPTAAPTPKIPGTGSISVSSSPSGADIYLDGSYQSTTPDTLNNVPAGSHTITLKFNNNQVTTTVYVVAGQSSTFSAQLNKVTNISVSSTPSGASIYIDGIYEGNTPKNIEVPAGSHSIRLQLDDYEEWSKTIDVKPASMSYVSATLNKTLRGFRGAGFILNDAPDVIKENQDVIANLLMDNSKNNVTLIVDAQVSASPGLHVSGDDFYMKQWEIIDEGYRHRSGAEKISGTFSIPPGESRNFSLLLKADESARNGTQLIKFTLLYYPEDGENKGDLKKMAFSYPLEVVMPPKEITVQTPIPTPTAAPTPKTPGFEVILSGLGIILALALRRR